MRESFYPYPYRVIRPLGNGGIGEIYLAYHENLQKQVVVKKIKDHCRDSIDCRVEVDILKNLHHQYLPQVYDFIQLEDEIYTVIDFIPGHDLEYYCRQHIVFSEEQLLTWLRQLLEVLDYLHTRKPMILHCDIKPANIMITEEGNVCLIDFNISLDGEGNKELIGLSSQFASPEQARKADLQVRYGTGDKVVLDARSDLYSLGAVFYFLISGIYPDARRNDFIDLKYIEHGYSEELANIIAKSMQPDVRNRFKSAKDMLRAVDHMEQWSSARIRQKKVLRTAGMAAAAIVIVLGTVLIYRGEAAKKTRFITDTDTYVIKEESWDYLQSEEAETKALLAEGLSLLNKEEYHKYYRKDKVRDAQVLYAVGKCALSLEEYEQAAGLLEDAVQRKNDDADMYRDLALAQAGDGSLEEARENLMRAIENGLEIADAGLIRAELALLSGDAETAYRLAQKSIEEASPDMQSEAVNILLKAAKSVGETEKTIQLLTQEAQNLEGSNRIYCLRTAAQLALQAEENEIARQCLEQIVESKMALLDDLYNLDSACEKLEDWEKSREVLTEITDNYDHQYKACIRMAYVYYRMNNDRRLADRTYVQVFFWYEKAQKYMETLGISQNSDPDMVQLAQIISQLEELGWKNEGERKAE